MVTYQLGNTVRKKFWNYKEKVNSIFVDEEVAFSLNTETCEYEILNVLIHIASI